MRESGGGEGGGERRRSGIQRLENAQRDSEGFDGGGEAARREALTGEGGGVVGGVSPQVLGGLGGRLGQALRAAAVTHTGGGKREQRAESNNNYQAS